MSPIRQLLTYLRPFRRDAIIAPLLMVLEVAMDLMLPFLMGRIIDVGIGTRQSAGRAQHRPAHGRLCARRRGRRHRLHRLRRAGGYELRRRPAQRSLSQDPVPLLRQPRPAGHRAARHPADQRRHPGAGRWCCMALRILVRAPLLVVGSLVMADRSPARVWRRCWPGAGAAADRRAGRRHPAVLAPLLRRPGQPRPVEQHLAGEPGRRAGGQGVRARPTTRRNASAQANETLLANSIQAMQFSALVGPFMMLVLNFGVAAAHLVRRRAGDPRAR